MWGTSVVSVLVLVLLKDSHAYLYDTYYYTQQVDHFSFHNNDTYQQRYLVNDGSWTQDGGPIFFYTGNEGDIEWFAKNTGFMWDIAPQYKALLVFAEHRFYGESMPYGNKSYDVGDVPK
jgi:lysosomal Pro-X carboxypeptidase